MSAIGGLRRRVHAAITTGRCTGRRLQHNPPPTMPGALHPTRAHLGQIESASMRHERMWLLG